MRYITLIPDYTGSCLKDDFEGSIDLLNLGLPKNFVDKIEIWHDSYKKIIPLSMEERKKIANDISSLDAQGMEFAKQLQYLIAGGAKVKYFSEGLLKYIKI